MIGQLKNYCSTHLLVLVGALLLAGCQGPQPRSTQQSDSGPSRIPAGVLTQSDPVPRDEPLSASGNSLSYVVFGQRYHRLDSARGFDQRGIASWYGRKFHGRLTASGEPYDMYAMTAAHKSLPLPTYVRVTNLQNNRSIVVRVNDRGPFVDDRLIDLSYAAAAKLDMLGAGTARVRVVALSGVPGEGPQVPAVQVATVVAPRTPEQRVLDARITALSTTSPKPQLELLAQNEGQNLQYLQLGAFGSYEAAGAMRARVSDRVGYTVFIAKQSGSELYRVHAGPFASEPLLGAAQTELRLVHSIDAIVVQLGKPGTACC